MTRAELILLTADQVRGNSDLTAFYLETYREVYGYVPSCTGCSFKSDYSKLIAVLNNTPDFESKITKNTEKMSTFKLKKTEGKIRAFVDGKTKKTHRLYDTHFTEEFVIGFLTNGTEEEIAERKAMFSKFPKMPNEEQEVEEVEKPKKNRNK